MEMQNIYIKNNHLGKIKYQCWINLIITKEEEIFKTKKNKKLFDLIPYDSIK